VSVPFVGAVRKLLRGGSTTRERSGPAGGPIKGRPQVNDLLRYADVFENVKPWSGKVPAGYIVDFLGIVTPKEFLEPWGYHPAYIDGATLDLPLPTIGKRPHGEDYWFETVNWVLAAQEARGRFVMMTLGALYGYQAVGCRRILQLLNPMPYKLVAVEAIPENMRRLRRLMFDNGIDPDDQWLIEAAVSGSNAPAFFPVGAPGAGSQNCISTDNAGSREDYAARAVAEGRAEEVLRNLMLHNSTGFQKEIAGDQGMSADIKLVSCVTIGDLLGPFDRVDYIEADMQESEIRAFPPFIDLLRRKVKRVHIATHGDKVHTDLRDLFVSKGWEMAFDYAPDRTHETPFGPLVLNDGVLTIVNPDL
jgi:hypothetical protein